MIIVHYVTTIFVMMIPHIVMLIVQYDISIVIPALSKESSGILLLPLSVRPFVRPSERKFVTGTPSTF